MSSWPEAEPAPPLLSRREPSRSVGQRGESGDVAGRAQRVSLMVSQPLTTPNVGLSGAVQTPPASASSLTCQTACSTQSGCFQKRNELPS